MGGMWDVGWIPFIPDPGIGRRGYKKFNTQILISFRFVIDVNVYLSLRDTGKPPRRGLGAKEGR